MTKAFKGLLCCSTGNCTECPYRGGEETDVYDCTTAMANAAKELVREKNQRIWELATENDMLRLERKIREIEKKVDMNSEQFKKSAAEFIVEQMTKLYPEVFNGESNPRT